MVLQSLVKLNNSIAMWNFATQIQVKTKKRSLLHSGSISSRKL